MVDPREDGAKLRAGVTTVCRVRGAVLSVLAVVSVLMFASAAGSAATTVEYKVIVHPDNAITEVDRGFLRAIYLRKAVDWSSGGPIRPIDLTRRFPVRERFLQDVVKKTPAQLKNYWNQQIFSGKGVPPPEAHTTEAAVAYVLTHAGAIAYLPVDSDAGRARVVQVK